MEKQLVIVPKTSFKADSRNPLRTIFRNAGYDRVADAAFDDGDECTEGDFCFRSIKGAYALACQLENYASAPIGIVMGSDILGEAQIYADAKYGVRSEISRLLTLGIGPCSLLVLAPKEAPVNFWEDMRGRRIYSKYPLLTKSLLSSVGLGDCTDNIRDTDGADTRLREKRSSTGAIAALEIVASGRTAEKSRLQIVRNELEYPMSGTTDFLRIQTDLFITNKSSITGRIRDALQGLGLALETARASNRSAVFDMNVPRTRLQEFTSFGMKGPTIGNVLATGSDDWIALRIAVSFERKNATRVALLARGAKDLLCTEGTAEPGSEYSEVLQVLPFSPLSPTQQ